MKKINLTCTLLVLLLGIYSCKKESIETSSLSSKNTSNAVVDDTVCRSDWYGIFNQNTPDRTIYTTAHKIIFDGYAHVKVPVGFARSAYETEIDLTTPDCAAVDGDSVQMSVNVMNPTDSANSQYTASVYLYMFGSEDSAYVQFNGYYSKNTKLGVGRYKELDIPGLYHLFSSYEVVSLVAKDHIISVYRGEKLITQVDYTGTNIGQLKRIAVGFRGSGYVDYVKLYNSTTGAMIMKEDFNIPHKSTDTWY